MLTQDDLSKLGTLIDEKLDAKLKPVKQDLRAIKTDVSELKTDVKRVESKLDELSDYVIPALGNIFKWTDDIHSAITGKKSSRALSEN